MKIGFICWRQGGGTSDYVSATPKKSWMKDLKKEQKVSIRVNILLRKH